VCRPYPLEKPPGSSLTVAVVWKEEGACLCRRDYLRGRKAKGRRT